MVRSMSGVHRERVLELVGLAMGEAAGAVHVTPPDGLGGRYVYAFRVGATDTGAANLLGQVYVDVDGDIGMNTGIFDQTVHEIAEVI
jgi:hypothetical protein